MFNGTMIQNQILKTLRAPESKPRLEQILATETLENRNAIGLKVCEEFGFYDTRGKIQQTGCLKALGVLERSGLIKLPKPHSVRQVFSPFA